MKNSGKLCQRTLSLDIRCLRVIFTPRSLIYCSLLQSFLLSFRLSVLLYFPVFRSASPLAPDVYWLFIREHHLMCLLSCPAFVDRATPRNIANWSVSLCHPLSGFVKWTTITLAQSLNHDPTPLGVFLSLRLSLSCHSENGIGMAKHWFESWLADPHTWLAALMSSLRFDEVATKGTRLIIWPPTFSEKQTRLPHHLCFSPSSSPPTCLLRSIVLLRWWLENEVMLVWTQTRTYISKGSPSLKWLGGGFYCRWQVQSIEQGWMIRRFQSQYRYLRFWYQSIFNAGVSLISWVPPLCGREGSFFNLEGNVKIPN